MVEVQSVLKETLENKNIRWEKPEKMHLTVLFIGELGEERITGGEKATEEHSRIVTEEERISELESLISTAAKKFSPFELAITGINAFSNNRRPRVVMANVADPAGAYAELQENIFIKLKSSGLPCASPKPPHITIARVRKGSVDLSAIEVQPRCLFEVSAVAIKESILHPTGAIHRTVSEVFL